MRLIRACIVGCLSVAVMLTALPSAQAAQSSTATRVAQNGAAGGFETAWTDVALGQRVTSTYHCGSSADGTLLGAGCYDVSISVIDLSTGVPGTEHPISAQCSKTGKSVPAPIAGTRADCARVLSPATAASLTFMPGQPDVYFLIASGYVPLPAGTTSCPQGTSGPYRLSLTVAPPVAFVVADVCSFQVTARAAAVQVTALKLGLAPPATTCSITQPCAATVTASGNVFLKSHVNCARVPPNGTPLGGWPLGTVLFCSNGDLWAQHVSAESGMFRFRTSGPFSLAAGDSLPDTCPPATSVWVALSTDKPVWVCPTGTGPGVLVAAWSNPLAPGSLVLSSPIHLGVTPR